MPSGPPDKVDFYPLTSYTTGTQRASAISTLIANFITTYGVSPNYVLMDSTVNGVHIGAY